MKINVSAVLNNKEFNPTSLLLKLSTSLLLTKLVKILIS